MKTQPMPQKSQVPHPLPPPLATKKEKVSASPRPEDLDKVEISKASSEEKKIEAEIEIKETYSPLSIRGIKRPGIFFISGFDFFGSSSYDDDGLVQLAESIPGAQHFCWNEKEKVMGEIKKRSYDQPIVLVGHSLGGDSALEIAKELNGPKHQFRPVALLVTLDSFGWNHNLIPQNVSKNLNFVGDKNIFLNDSANLAQNFQATEVVNELRHEDHSQLDNSEDVQSKIMNSIFKIIKHSDSFAEESARNALEAV